MPKFNLNTSKHQAFVRLLSFLLLTACQQPVTYAPVKTVNQAILTDDEARLRKAREQRRLDRIKLDPQKSAEIVDNTAKAPGKNINNNSHPPTHTTMVEHPSPALPPVDPSLLPAKPPKQHIASQKQLVGRAKTSTSMPEQAEKAKHTVKPTIQTVEALVEQTHSKQVNIDQIKPTKALKLAKNSPDKTKVQKPSEQNAHPDKKNISEKTLIISNDNKKMLKLNFGWPIRGKVIKNFAESGSKGIDIAGKIGQPVLAAEAGKAVYCGNGLAAYGNLIIVKHNETYLSAYAYNSQLNIKEGQAVKKGQAIAEVGRARSQKPALHFQIRKNGKSINPLAMLPKH